MKLLKNVGVLLTMLTLGYAPFVGAQDNVIKRNWEQSTGISKLFLGYTGATPDVGISHERRKGAMGWDLMALFSGDDDDGVGRRLVDEVDLALITFRTIVWVTSTLVPVSL